MRNILCIIIILFLSIPAFSKSYEELTPEKRQLFASDWLDTGKAFYASKKLTKAKTSYEYVIEIYPMGQDAEEARNLLKKQFNMSSKYNPDKEYLNYIKTADKQTNMIFKINNYLMAIEIKPNKNVLQNVAVAFMRIGNKDKAMEYLNKAKEMGLKEAEIDPILK
jgi:tetratricopeptide (TPR) repeat protein